MNPFRHAIVSLAAALCLSSGVDARTISWFCLPNRVNLDSGGAAMDSSFTFQLGVFAAGFVPTVSNTAEWAGHWVSAQESSYNTLASSFTNSITVSGNTAPFTVGAKAYVWGRGNGGEWILFSNTGWTWPSPDPMNPFPLDWKASDANEVILGEMISSGTPFQMKSAAVLSYSSWRDTALAGEPLGGPNDDPDLDGCMNALEFVFGTPPLVSGPGAATPSSLVEISSQRYLQISVPRLRDRLAIVTVEVSGDLVTWHSGTAHTVEVSNTANQLVVRDLTPSAPGSPRRYMRARVVVTP